MDMRERGREKTFKGSPMPEHEVGLFYLYGKERRDYESDPRILKR